MRSGSTLPLTTGWMVALGCLSVAVPEAASAIKTVAWKVPAKAPDAAVLALPGDVTLQGFLGRRVAVNASERLAKVDLEPLLAGFRQKPGSHPWMGEHLGKWLHAATLAWAQTADDALKARLDYAVAELIKAQEPDGYLGTYTPNQRFGLYEGADWDVWSHKYCLMGLLTYHQYTGDAAALEASRKAADLLLATFPTRKSILAAGTHVGMAATSVLEPMVLLYRLTAEPRYHEFCEYLVKSWDEPNGPRILATLLTEKQVNRTANGKAYEMLSNLVGLCELYRVSGEPRYLRAALNAWEDVVSKRLYITGSASQGEHFRDDHYLPNGESAHVAETCVTTTWIQFNEQLLRLTAEARFGHELERTFYNHLTAAQRPDGAQWCYFTPLEGRKPYGPGINCCVSSGPRGVALVPPAAAFTYRAQGAPGIAINLFELAEFRTTVDGEPVGLRVRTEFPKEGRMTVTVNALRPVSFALRIRQPAWAGTLKATATEPLGAVSRDGWLEIAPRAWAPGTSLRLTFTCDSRLIPGDHTNASKAALAWGPFVLAYDTSENPGLPVLSLVALGDAADQAPATLASAAPLRLTSRVRIPRSPAPEVATLVPFADAGARGGRYAVWLRAPDAALPVSDSLFAFADEARSQTGNVSGSITDGDPASFVVTFNGRPQAEAWFEVRVPQPVTLGRVVFTHGQNFHDGGWFDTSGGKPRVEVRRTNDGSWETVGEITDYPATSSRDNGGLKAGQPFQLRLTTPVEAVAVRVIGRPAGGDNPAQAFASCGELEAFPK